MSTTTTTKSTLDDLAEKAERIQAQLAVAQAAAEAERVAAEQRRAEAHAEFDRQTWAEYDPAPYESEVEAARAALTAALLADPVHQAIIRVNVAESLRTNAAVDYQAAAGRLGVDTSTEFVHAIRLVADEDLDRVIALEVGRQVEDLLDAREQERVDVGEKAAKQHK